MAAISTTDIKLIDENNNTPDLEQLLLRCKSMEEALECESLMRLLIPHAGNGLNLQALQLQWQQEERAISIGFLWRSYKPQFWAVEVLEMLKKFLLIGLPMLTARLTAEGSYIETAYGSLVIIISMLCYSNVHPYRYRADEYLMLPTQFVLSVTMAGGTLMTYGVDVNVETGVNVLVFLTCIPVVVILIFSILRPRKVNSVFDEPLDVTLRRELEPVLDRIHLKWVDVEPLVKELESLNELRCAVSNPVGFLEERLNDIKRNALLRAQESHRHLPFDEVDSALLEVQSHANAWGDERTEQNATSDHPGSQPSP
jgi:hypothetical protein